MKITIEKKGKIFTAEIPDNSYMFEITETFRNLLIGLGYPPEKKSSTINFDDDTY